MAKEISGGEGRFMGGVAWRWTGWWLAAAGFYLLIYGELSWVQVLVGLASGGLTASLVLVAERLAGVRFAPGAAWVRRMVWPIPLQVLRDSGRVLIATVRMTAGRGVHGHFQAVPFAAVQNTPKDAARRALAVLESSLAPNSFVISIDCDHRLLLQHRLLAEAARRPRPDQEQAT